MAEAATATDSAGRLCRHLVLEPRDTRRRASGRAPPLADLEAPRQARQQQVDHGLTISIIAIVIVAAIALREFGTRR